jgi:hypothetical protein
MIEACRRRERRELEEMHWSRINELGRSSTVTRRNRKELRKRDPGLQPDCGPKHYHECITGLQATSGPLRVSLVTVYSGTATKPRVDLQEYLSTNPSAVDEVLLPARAFCEIRSIQVLSMS